MKIKDKRKAGEILNRSGLALRIINIATEISQGTFKDAMTGAGRIAELVDCAKFDEYWSGKVNMGKLAEREVLLALLEGGISRASVVQCVRPTENQTTGQEKCN